MIYNKCGKITASHGLKGDLKVQNYSDFDRFYEGALVYYKKNTEYLPLEVRKAVDYKNGLLVAFKDLVDINQVEFLVGKDLYAVKDETDLAEDEYFYSDLIGKDIYNEEGLLRGKVLDIKEYPQADMLVIEVNGKNKLVPFLNEFISEVKEDRIIIKEIEGLLWK